MVGAHNGFLVGLSLLIAVFASFTALSIAGRLWTSRGWMRRVWLAGASIALGGGIWSMHFVAMLAFGMPGMALGYDPALTLISLALALVFTSAGFAILSSGPARWPRLAGSGLLMGAGVVAMHYVGMAAMRMPMTLTYDPFWLVVSVLIAIGAATAAVWLATLDQSASRRLAAATVMGAAISGMHYAGMRGAIFRETASGDMGSPLAAADQTSLAMGVAALTIFILLLALGAARLERLFLSLARREARAALRLKVADILRDGSAPDALSEVAKLMGEHFGVTRTGYGQLDRIEDIFDYDVCWTDGAAPPLLGRLPAAAFGVKIVAQLNAGRTVVIEDLFEAELSSEARTRATAREVDTRAILVVPFVRDGRLRTIVYLNHRQPRRWRPDEVAFLEELAERTRLVIERDNVERQLRELNSTLEARVEERTAELRQAQEALLQSQKMEAVGQLASGLAHDFNNVLGAIVGAFELTERHAEAPERVRRYAEAGLSAAERGSRLTAQLLAFSRSRTIQLQPVVVRDAIDSLRDLLGRTLGPMITLDIRPHPAPTAVMADPTQLEMMVLNLAINSRDAMPEGGRLMISTTVRAIAGDAELANGDYVEIAVADTGTGMDEVTLRRAMEPFFTTKPVGKGTGLGLAQIYATATQAGGTVRIESAVGAGTTVRVLLPSTQREPRGASDAAAPGDGLPERRVRLLVVDDDQDHRSLLATGLEARGHHVRQADCGAQAFEALEAEVPDVLVLDFAMPEMNGAQVAAEVRRRWPELPIVFTSGFADTAALEAIEGGSVAIVRKPFRMEDLLRAIQESAGPLERPGAEVAVAD